jgi:hypothetical protein
MNPPSAPRQTLRGDGHDPICTSFVGERQTATSGRQSVDSDLRQDAVMTFVLLPRVCLLAALFPFFNETLAVPHAVGVTLIVIGVITINFRRDSDHGTQEFSR